MSALERWIGRPPLPDLLAGEDRSFGGDGLFVDLIPQSCWFTNVRSCVGRRDWDRLRRMVYRRARDRCEICGAGRDPDVKKWLEAHERWEYDEATLTQRLRRIVCLCSFCHEATEVAVGSQTSCHIGDALTWDNAACLTPTPGHPTSLRRRGCKTHR
jgi:hypothetical protein